MISSTNPIEPVGGVPHPPEVRAAISALIREWAPTELTFTVDFFEESALIYGNDPSGHRVVAHTVWTDEAVAA